MALFLLCEQKTSVMRIPALFLLACTTGSVLAQTPEIRVSSQVEEAILFHSGAHVTRSAEASIEPGKNTIHFHVLPGQIEQNSIQLSTDADVTLLTVQLVNNYEAAPDIPRIEKLKSKVAEARNTVQELEAQKQAAQSELEFLSSGKNAFSGPNTSVSQLEELLKYAEDNRYRIERKLDRISTNANEAQKKLNRLEQELNELQSRYGNLRNSIVVELESAIQKKVRFQISYFTPSAGWQNSYTAKATSLEKPLKLIQKASAFQHTGEDWQDVKLSFSTATPSRNNSLPPMKPLVVGPAQVISSYDVNPVSGNKPMTKRSTYQTATRIENLTQNEYFLKDKQQLPTSRQSSRFVLQEIALDAKYQHIARPRLSKEVFLIAKVADWEQHKLLPGEIQIFLEETFTGSTYLNTRNTNDTLSLSLGPDQNLKVECERMAYNNEKLFLGKKRKKTYTWKFTVVSSKESPVSLLIEDRLPISHQEEIEVEILNVDGGSLIPKKGYVRWRTQLNSGEKTTQNLKYSITHPSDMDINQ